MTDMFIALIQADKPAATRTFYTAASIRLPPSSPDAPRLVDRPAGSVHDGVRRLSPVGDE